MRKFIPAIGEKSSFPYAELVRRDPYSESYSAKDGMLVRVATDAISVGDMIMSDPVPGKGLVHTQLSLFWFEFLNRIAPSNLVTADVNKYPGACWWGCANFLRGRSTLVHETEPLSMKCTVWGYLSGQLWTEYQKSNIVRGVTLPTSLQQSEKLPTPFTTFSPNNTSGLQAGLRGMLNRKQTDEISVLCKALYEKAAAHAFGKGIIIADAEFTLGVCGNELSLVDEVLTPDSAHFWSADRYQVGIA